MKKSSNRYSPRPGSKIAAAIEAVRDGPKTPRELAKVLQRDSSAINTLLLRALTHAAIIRVKDQRGRLYFAAPDAVLDQQFTVVAKDADTANATETPAQAKQNIIRLQLATNGKNGTLISSNVLPLSSTEHDALAPADDDHLAEEQAPPVASDAASPPVIAGLFSDGELTIAVGGECLQLNTAQRQQLYTYLHKIRYLE